MNTKTPIYLSAIPILFFAGAAWIDYDSLPRSVWAGLACLFAFQLIVFTANHWLTGRALKQAVKLEVRPNQVVVDGVELQIPFSSESHLFSGRASMVAMISRVQDQVLSRQTGAFSMRRSVQVSIAPENLHLTELEVDAFGEMLGEVFVDPSLQIIGQRAAGEPLPVMRAF